MSKTQTMRRVMLTIPPELLQQVNQAASRLDFNRSRFIRQAVKAFIEQQRRRELRELLKEGCVVNAERDLCIAEGFAHADYETAARHLPWEE